METEENYANDDFGRKIHKGDFVYFGPGHYHGAQIAVIRNIAKSFHIITVTNKWNSNFRIYDEDDFESDTAHVNFKARSCLKMEPHWLYNLPNKARVATLFAEQAKVLDGHYDRKCS